MSDFKLDKKDLIWSYLAQFLSIGAGAITLPFILHKLSAEEIGLNYILLTIGSVISLVDLGFAPQFAINFSYVFSGAQEIKKEGVGVTGKEVNYELLSNLLKTARYIYGVLGIIAFLLLLAIGTPYMYITTHGFSAVNNALLIWVIYSFGVLFQIFYSYYFSMLLGSGKIKEQKQAVIGNKLLYITILLLSLYSGLGLLSVALAQMISPFFGRIISYRFFYTEEIKAKLNPYNKTERKKIINTFHTLWHNAKRTAIMQIGGFAILRFSMFIAGLYLTLDAFASYGLMIQVVGISGALACTLMQISQPKFASLRASRNRQKLLSSFSTALILFYAIFLCCNIVLIFYGNTILKLIGSNAQLPSKAILCVYALIMLLEYNHSNFAILIGSNNKIPFAPASITTGVAVCLGAYLVLRFTTWGIMGLIIVQGTCQAAYQNWKWPSMALKDLNISFCRLMNDGFANIKKVYLSKYRNHLNE